MYAIIEDGGKQYKVSEGDVLLIERKDLEPDTKVIEFDRVMMVGEGENARIGTPWVDGAKVIATIASEIKTPKVVGVKFKRRKGYMRKFGHRQRMLKVEVSKIDA